MGREGERWGGRGRDGEGGGVNASEVHQLQLAPGVPAVPPSTHVDEDSGYPVAVAKT